MSSVLILDWKQEPESPLSADEVSWVSDDAALYWTSAGDNEKAGLDVSEYESKAEAAAKLLDDLENLENLDDWIKAEEPFSNWLEEKMLPTMFDIEASQPTAVKVEDIKPAVVPDTQSLLKEFETVFDAVEINHGALTPPQSPPYEQPPILTTLEPIAAQPLYAVPIKQPEFIVPDKHLMASVAAVYTPIQPRPIQLEYITPATPQPNVAHELAVVEELVRTRAEDMVQWSDPSSPGSSCSSSSNFGDCSSDDPEWIPEPVDALPQETPLKTSRKRSKPYSRNVEEKKSRKKEQNKNAATRYRMKKKAEIAEILDEERGLQNQNEELETKISDVQREIKYLKNLMRDLFKAKGLIN